MNGGGLHHLVTRRRIYANLEPFPHPKKLKRYFDYAMYGIGLLAPIALVPQAAELFISKNASSLSLPTWAILGTINFLWALYGSVHKEPQIAVANFFSGILNFVVVAGIVLYH